MQPLNKLNYHGLQPVVKDHSPRGKLNVEHLYASFSTVASEIHTMRTHRNLTTMDVKVGSFEKAEQRRKVFFRSKKLSPRPNINSMPVE